ncbi:PhzF family phenazine biosynthesis protein [Streptomyces sp. BBFR102]|uniref:PhzF family phenazine biosynthesis protein n=1 Tax=Streptomyces sp. BBFR102 TaxID=3448171 RepID=UPI003F52A129
MSHAETPAPPAVEPAVLRYAAFTHDPAGGNPAGVVLDASGLDDATMLAVAARIGYSETAFLTPPPTDAEAAEGVRAYRVRYFSPQAEVPFCGHATVATAVALGERHGTGAYLFHTQAGPVPVAVDERDGALRATLTGVPPHTEEYAEADLAEALAALGWEHAELDPSLAPRVAYAGARHLVLAAATRDRLARLDYDFERLRALMLRTGLTTVQLVWRDTTDPLLFHVRDPFPVGGVVEDPATGAAALAFGAYAREAGLVPDDAELTLCQGEDMGRPGVLTVTLTPGDPRVRVTGAGVPLPEPAA